MFEQSIRYRAQSTPQALAIETGQGNASYAQLHATIKAVEQALRRAGIVEGQTVLVSNSRPMVHWSILFGLEAIGAVSVTEDARANASKTMRFDAVVSEHNLPIEASIKIACSDEWLASAVAAPLENRPERQRSRNDSIRILLTSGTTGEVKQVLFTRAMMDAHIASICVDTLRPKSRMLSTMGIDSLGGYLISHAVWNTGGSMIYAVNPSEALEACEPDFMLMAPIQLQMLLASLPKDAPLRPGLRIGVGGSNLPRRLYEDAAQRLTSDIAMAYGATEVGYVAGCPAALGLGQPGATGYVLPGAQLEIVDEAGTVLPNESIGRVRIRTEGIADGYHGTGASGEGQFSDGWFYPGDLGWIRKDGLFVLEGRNDDVLNIGGVKLSAWSIEETVLSEPSVLEAAAFVLPVVNGVGELRVAIVVAPGTDLNRLAEVVSQRATHEFKLISVASLPRNAMGKVRRHELRDAVAAHLASS